MGIRTLICCTMFESCQTQIFQVPMTYSSLCWGLMQGHLKIAAGDAANVLGNAEEAPLNGRNCSLKRQYSLLSPSEYKAQMENYHFPTATACVQTLWSYSILTHLCTLGNNHSKQKGSFIFSKGVKYIRGVE